MTAILVIDDEPAVCSVIKLLLSREGFSVVTCPDGQAALSVLPSADFAAALIDLGLDQVDGRHIIEVVRASKPALPIVVMSGVLVGDADDHLPGVASGIEGLYRLPKPFKPQSLVRVVKALTNPQAHEVERIGEVARGA